jgi:hypothetical protein
MLTSLWQLLLHEECPPPASEYLSTETKEHYVYQFQFGQTCQDLVSDSCHVTQQALRHVLLPILTVEIKQCLLCVLLKYTTLPNI